MMRRLMAILLVLALPYWAMAEEPAEYESEWVHAAVEAMFRAAAGCDYEEERQLRREMDADETARSQKLAEHRKMTLPWLMAAMGAGEECLLEWLYPEESADGEKRIWDAQAAYEAMCAGGGDYAEMMAEVGGVDAETALEASRAICAQWMAEVEHAALKEINGDYVFWIYSADSPIDYPVVQGEDNSTWLHRLFNGGRNAAGTLFVDYRNLEGFQDPNTLIYGHHMRNDSMFGTLTDYGEQAYFDAHPWFVVLSAEGNYIVEAMAGYVTNRNDHCYDIAISDEADFKDFVDAAMQKTDFQFGANAASGDRLITLSTCAYVFDNARYIVIGKMNEILPDAEDMQQAGD